MPVFCIAYGCDNDKRSAPEKTSFHRLPLNKPSLLKQVRILVNVVILVVALTPFLAELLIIGIIYPPILSMLTQLIPLKTY